MPIYQATAFFSQEGYGWSETYYRDGGSATDLAVLADFDREKIWTPRAKCLGKQGVIQAQRASFITVRGDSVLNYIELPGNANFDSEDPSTALLVRYSDPTNTRAKNTFLRGVADSVVIEGGKVARGFGMFTAALDSFKGAIIQNLYGWMGTNTKIEHPLVGYTTDAEKRLVFEVDPGPLPIPDIGSKFVATGKNIGANGRSVLNTTLSLVRLSDTECRTAKATAAFPFSGPGGFLVTRTRSLIVIANSRLQRVVERKAGKVSYRSPGRLPVRPRG